MINFQDISKPTRRLFLAGQACALSITGAASANASVIPPSYDLRTSPTWGNVTPEKMNAFVRDRFTAVARDGTSLSLRLIKVETTHSGPARPRTLERREGLVATFRSPQLNWFVENGAQTVRMNHPVLGHSDIFVSATPKRRGGHELLVVLN